MKNHQGTISRTHQREDREKSQSRRLAVKPSRFSIARVGLIVSDDDLDRHGGVLIYQSDPPKLVSVADKKGQSFPINTGE